jgi:hypothetical protein
VSYFGCKRPPYILTIDHSLLSIIMDTVPRIDDSHRPQPGKSRQPGLRSTRGPAAAGPLPFPAEAGRQRLLLRRPGVARRACALQVTAVLGVDNPPIEAADATAPREAFLGNRVLALRRLPPPARRGFDDSVEKQPTIAYSHIS